MFAAHKLLRTIARATVGVDDDGTRAREVAQQSCPHRLHHLSDGTRVVVRWHTDHQVHFPDVNQLADEIVGQNGCFGQEILVEFQKLEVRMLVNSEVKSENAELKAKRR
jgi:hypothetical protein